MCSLVQLCTTTAHYLFPSELNCWFSSVLWIHDSSVCVCVCVCACVRAHTLKSWAAPWTGAHQAPPSMGFSRQEYWSGLPWPPPGESSQPRDWTYICCVSCIGRRILYHCATWEALKGSKILWLSSSHANWPSTIDLAFSKYFMLVSLVSQAEHPKCILKPH